MKYLVKTLSAWTTFEDLILKEKDKKELMDKQQLKLNFN